MQRVKRAATTGGASLLLITHPSKTMNMPELTALAGSAAFARFAQTILWLQNHQPQKSNVTTACGTDTKEHNRTLHILKARNGKGHGMAVACEFVKENLTLKDLGLIVKGKD